MILADLLSGIGVPLPFFPKAFQIVAYLMPFRYVSDLPFRLLVGNIPINEGLIGIVVQLFYIIILIFFGNKLMKKALKRAVIQGG